MKTIKILGISLSLLLQISSNLTFSQCNSFVKKVDLSALDEFSYCGEVKVAQMYRSDSAEVSMKLSARTKYRILVSAQEYLGDLQLEVMNSSDELMSIPIEDNDLKYWEIFSDEKERADIKIKFKRDELHKRSNHRINASGCVVLAVGKISSEDFVDNSGLSTDL